MARVYADPGDQRWGVTARQPHPAPDDKAAARSIVRARLAGADPAARADASARIVARLRPLAAAAAPRIVAAFDPLPSEVDLRPLLSELAAQGRLALPRIDWSAGQLTFASVRNLQADLTPDRHGLRVPAPSRPAIPLSRLGLVLVPGVAFDRSGRRLGRGGGFYDRLLARSDLPTDAPRVGVAFDFQVLDAVPTGAADQPVDRLVTESGTWMFRDRA